MKVLLKILVNNNINTIIDIIQLLLKTRSGKFNQTKGYLIFVLIYKIVNGLEAQYIHLYREIAK